MHITLSRPLLVVAVLLAAGLNPALSAAESLKIAYSDWPGWVAWEIGIQKGWFEEAGVPVEFVWMDYVASMDAYVGNQVDAVCMTNGDALVTGASGKPSIGIIINDYSNGNDMVVGAPGIASLAELEGKKIGVEIGFVDHLLLLHGLESVDLSENDVSLVNMATGDAPQTLASGEVSAIAAWQPNSGQTLKTVAGSKRLYSSADAPGIIYDLLYDSPESLSARRGDWQQVIGVWYRIVDYLKDEGNFDEAMEILSARVDVSPEEYEEFFHGTYILDLDEALAAWSPGDGLDSVYGSSEVVDDFNVKYGVYDAPQNVEAYLDPSLTEAYAKTR